MKIVFLPPYSPKFNPIELSFSLLNSWFRLNYDKVLAAWGDNDNPERAPDLILSLIDQVDGDMAQSWFEYCGYDRFFD
jgi:transposase